jgi:UDP-N-acetylglucosamine enolpyruvyl transferase
LAADLRARAALAADLRARAAPVLAGTATEGSAHMEGVSHVDQGGRSKSR